MTGRGTRSTRTRESESDFSQREVDTTLALLIDTKAWLQRRTDRIELIDTYTIRRTIRLEVELPEWAGQAAAEPDCRLILPVAVFAGGQALRNVEVTVGQEPAGMLTRHSGDRLTELLGSRLEKNGDLGIPDTTLTFLEELLGSSEVNGGTEHSERFNIVGNRNYILFVSSERALEGDGRTGSRFVMTVVTDQTLVRKLGPASQPNAIRKTLRAIGLGRTTELETESSRGCADNSEGQGAGNPPKRDSLLMRFLSGLSKLLAKVFPSDTAFILAQPVSSFGDARSWQLEIFAPEELRITDGALVWWQDEIDVGKDQMARGVAPPTRRATTAVALARFRVQADSIRHVGILVTYATAALLALAILIAALPNGNRDPIIDAVVAILVIAPSLGASIVTNPENHELAGDFLKPFRQRIYSVGFLAALAAALFVLDDQAGGFGFKIGMFGCLALMLIIAHSFHRIKSDIDLRAHRNSTELHRARSDLDFQVFEESTSAERARRGLFGRARSKWVAELHQHDRPALTTLSVDSVDLGPRAIMRLPSYSQTSSPVERVPANTLESLDWATELAETKARIPGLADRFCYDAWPARIPPAWFFWSADIDPDYTKTNDGAGTRYGKPRAKMREAERASVPAGPLRLARETFGNCMHRTLRRVSIKETLKVFDEKLRGTR